MTTPVTCPYCADPLALDGALYICRSDDCHNVDEPMTASDVENVYEREGMRAIERGMS